MLIYEKNDIEINELVTPRGHHHSNPLGDFFGLVSYVLDSETRNKLFRKYFQNSNLSKIDDKKIDDYFYFLEYSSQKPSGMRNFIKYDVVSGFAYYIAKKYFKLKSGGFGLEYVKSDDNDGDKTFFFFDTAFKIFIGKVSIEKIRNQFIKGNVYKVGTAAAERKLIGMGYGLKMYLTILEYCDFLISDSILFTGSFRIWSEILPKYVNVWWVNEEKKKVKKITLQKPFAQETDDVDFFVASIYHKKV